MRFKICILDFLEVLKIPSINPLTSTAQGVLTAHSPAIIRLTLCTCWVNERGQKWLLEYPWLECQYLLVPSPVELLFSHRPSELTGLSIARLVWLCPCQPTVTETTFFVPIFWCVNDDINKPVSSRLENSPHHERTQGTVTMVTMLKPGSLGLILNTSFFLSFLRH